MAVDDHGLEVLKKSGEYVTAGDKSDYYIKTKVLDASFQPDGYVAGIITKVTLSDSAWTALPTTALIDRQTVSLQNRSGQNIYVNYVNTANVADSWVIPDQYERSWPVQEGAVIYARSSSGSVDIIVEELKK